MKALALSLVLPLLSVAAAAQTEPGLRDEIAAMDRKLFDAFNARDIETVRGIFDQSLEFYHDQAGLAGYEQTLRQLKENFARPGSPHRELVPGSVAVYPIKDYGAIQIGAHRFCHDDNGKEDCGVFQFVHVWQKKDGNWKLTRVISYDH